MRNYNTRSQLCWLFSCLAPFLGVYCMYTK
nr:MAG TPA: hypothetical protein [Caudoviricetes sp.]